MNFEYSQVTSEAMTESLKPDAYVIGTYQVVGEIGDITKYAEWFAIEQSTGTWVRVPEETDEVREKYVAKVIGAYLIPSYESALPKELVEKTAILRIAYSVENIGYQIPELLVHTAGNITSGGKVKLLELEFPQSFTRHFQGPKFGLAGVREILGVPKRPLLIPMIKPCSGIPPEVTGKLVYELASGGADIIKDDEILADPEYCPVYRRVEEGVKALDRAYKETGHKALYAVNITDSPTKMHNKALEAVKAGANCLMVVSYPVGLAAVQEIAEDSEINVPILSHTAFSGAIYESPYNGLSSHVALGKLPRLAGVDIALCYIPDAKLPVLKERFIRVISTMRSSFYNIKKTFPFVGGGCYAGMTHYLVSMLGYDFGLGVGGGVHAHPMGATAGAKAFRQAIDAIMDDIPLREAAASYKELKAAIDEWGIWEENPLNFKK
ncbi:RuBisCO large subunit C-terminal-like domain-containing protein [Chloroflexota bacterium]